MIYLGTDSINDIERWHQFFLWLSHCSQNNLFRVRSRHSVQNPAKAPVSLGTKAKSWINPVWSLLVIQSDSSVSLPLAHLFSHPGLLPTLWRLHRKASIWRVCCSYGAAPHPPSFPEVFISLSQGHLPTLAYTRELAPSLYLSWLTQLWSPLIFVVVVIFL